MAPLVVAEMVTLLITSFFILAFLAVVVYFWQKPASTKKQSLDCLHLNGAGCSLTKFSISLLKQTIQTPLLIYKSAPN